MAKFARHVFLSYMREDSAEVDGLQRILEAAEIPVWRDTADLWPGEDWRAKVREAITDGALGFIACFSSRSVSRQKSHQNEELLLAVEQVRLRRPSQPWLLPVRFDECALPDLALGSGRSLGSIQRVDLFGPNRDVAAVRLVIAVTRLLGQDTLGVRQVSEAAAGKADEHRPDDSGRSSHRAMAMVLCSLNVEYEAVRSHLIGLQSRDHPAGTRFEIGLLAGTNWQVALAVTGSGNVGAAVIAERAISLFDPDVLLCVGVAASLKHNVKLGDVVVATRVDTYHDGTAAGDFLAQPQTWPAPRQLDQLARQLDQNGAWRRHLPVGTSIEVHFSPIAAGEVVLDSRQSKLFAQLRLHNNDAAAIEMEGAGIAQAAYFNHRLPVLVIRGISDLADGTKATADRAGWQQRASGNAAAFAASLMENLVPPGRPSNLSQDR